MGGQRGVWVLAICCALVFACASCRAPGSEELREVLVYVRNDMSTPVIIELRAHNLRDNHEVPPLVRASLVWWPGESLTARVFSADCSALGTVELTVERSILFVESDGQLHRTPTVSIQSPSWP
jgi:hypothetical protein